MSNTVIDSDILIDIVRKVPATIAHLNQISQRSKPVISAITYMELMVGCRNKHELRQMEAFLEKFELVKVNADITDTAMMLIRTYNLSHGLLIPDAIIASTALWLDCPISSKNQRDFRFIPTLNVLPYP